MTILTTCTGHHHDDGRSSQSECENSSDSSDGELSDDDDEEFDPDELQCMNIANFVVKEKLSNVSTANFMKLLRSLGQDVSCIVECV